MRAAQIAVWVFLLLGFPLAVLGPSIVLHDEPERHAPGHWILEGEVVQLRKESPYGARLSPQPVLRLDVHRVIDSGSGDAPSGTIDIPYDEWSSGHERLREGETFTLAASPFRQHDPETGNTTNEGLWLEDVKAGCCWEGRLGWAAILWPAGGVVVGMAAVAGLGIWRWQPPGLAVVAAVVAGLGLGVFLGNLAGPGHAPFENHDAQPATIEGWIAWIAGGVGLLAVPFHGYHARRHATGWIAAVAFLAVQPWLGPAQDAIVFFAFAGLLALPMVGLLLAWPVAWLRRLGAFLPLVPLLVPLVFVLGGDGDAKAARLGMGISVVAPLLLWGDMRSAWRPVPENRPDAVRETH